MKPDRPALFLGELHFEVDPSASGRVTSFRLGELEMLLGQEANAANHGSTLWTSPQSDWGWPPPPEFDQVAYDFRVDGEAMVLRGPAIESLGVRIVKRFEVDAARGALLLTYTLTNVSDSSKTYAPWEVSRVEGGGLTFFPTGSVALGPLPVVFAGGATWYQHVPSALDETGKKHSADGKAGYVAHAQRGLLFVKGFADLPPEAQAPGEGEVEVYGNSRYVEVEVQGPYARLAPGQSLDWSVHWWLRRLPPGLEPSLGDPRLLDLAARVIAGTSD